MRGLRPMTGALTAKPADVEEILDTLVLMGRAREEAEGYALK